MDGLNGLKRASVTFTDSDDYQKQLDLAVSEVRFNFKDGYIETVYDGRKSAESEAKGVPGRMLIQRIEIDYADSEIVELILSNSGKLWEVNRAKPLILDFSETDANGKVLPVKKSLDELDAEVYDVDFPVPRPQLSTNFDNNNQNDNQNDNQEEL